MGTDIHKQLALVPMSLHGNVKSLCFNPSAATRHENRDGNRASKVQDPC